ncbi:MAG: anthranilate synthase component I family protein [Propionibacteriales bacterium]|nr:anthranilate synthase component I family protein [Propionibacteriales bacterium]
MPWVDPEDFYVAHVAGRSRAFWLDGAGARPWSGHVSIIGWLDDDEPSLEFDAGQGAVWERRDGDTSRCGDDIFATLRGLLAEPGPPCRWVGWFGYAARADLPVLHDGEDGAPDACWMGATRWVELDHQTKSVRAVTCAPDGGSWTSHVGELVTSTSVADPVPAAESCSFVRQPGEAAYRTAFEEVQRQLRLGNSYETNLTYRAVVRSRSDPLDTYRRLRSLSPAPYAAYLTHNGVTVLSSSPERFATIAADGRIETRPIKGTTARHLDPAIDTAQAERLRTDPKFRGENLMIVDLLRNDLSRVCEVGSVQVTDLMQVESYPRVHQLVSTIEGHLRDGVSAIDAVWALFPGGSMTGAPKERTMAIIAGVESTSRGVYSGALGWLDADGSADLAIIIRTLVHKGNSYVLGTGGGITVRSRADEEYAEAGWKANRLLAALGQPHES